MDQLANSPQSALSGANIARIRARRHLTDKVAARLIALGGISVIFAVCLIFFYLLWEVTPLFRGASFAPLASFQAPIAAQTYYVDLDESASMGFQLTAQSADFFNVADGKTIKSVAIGLPANATVTSFAVEAPETQLYAFGLSTGSALLLRDHYETTYEGSRAVPRPTLLYPFGEAPIALSEQAIQSIAIRDKEDGLRLAWVDANNMLAVRDLNKVTAFMSEEVTLEPSAVRNLPHPEGKIDRLFISPNQRWLFALDFQQAVVDVYDLNQADSQLAHVERVGLTHEDGKITSAILLNGGISLMVGTEKGTVHQWFQVRDDNAGVSHLNWVRSFKVSKQPVVALAIEQRRKGFAAADAAGTVAVFNATSEKEALNEKILANKPSVINIAPRANAFLSLDENGNFSVFHVDNAHPEVSWRSLWSKVWYENYPGPSYTWQSSSANTDFEPKFSLVPLTFGTLKAAFYSMLLSIPLAVFGAMFTAYFMAPRLRTKVKPAIEVMGSMPTVILGFLAGLWLAPMAEEHLPGLFALLVVTPVMCLLTAFIWSRMPLNIRLWIPEGWEPLALLPIVILSGWMSMAASVPVELAFFGGDMRNWLSNVAGISFDQRNSLIVGFAMGFAVIPIIFSIAEDAVFAVPKNLAFGSLALGATPWQTMVRIILPTASPGIFSGIMIGFGRAVGETMIVLMSTGNTPIMNVNIFEGLRSLAANIAVEMGEAEVGSSHFRILFLSALVLFVFTFIINTTAELVRQRLREKYGRL